MAINQGDGAGGGSVKATQGRTPGRTTKDRNPMVAYVPPLPKGGQQLPAWAVPNNFMGNSQGTPTAYVPPLPENRSIPAYNDPSNFNVGNPNTVKPTKKNKTASEIIAERLGLGMPIGMGNEMPVPDFMQYTNVPNVEEAEDVEQTGEVGGVSKEEFNMSPDPSTLIPPPGYMIPLTGLEEEDNNNGGGFSTVYNRFRRGGRGGGYSGYSNYTPAWYPTAQGLYSWNFRD